MTKMDNHSPLMTHHSSLRARTGLVAIVLLSAAVAIVPLAFFISGLMGVSAAMAALAICLSAGVLALVAAHPFRAPELLLYQVLITMAIRMVVPLVVCILIYFKRGAIAEAGLVYYLLVFYGLTLVIETILVTRGQSHGPANASS